VEQEERRAERSVEDIATIIEDNAERELEKYMKRGLGDYTIIITVDKSEKGIDVAAEVEVRSSVLEKDVLESIVDEVMYVIKRSADEVIKVRSRRGAKKSVRT
jgi:hypothetical protein